MIFRLLWNALQTKPKQLGEDPPIVKKMAKTAHYIFYLLVFVLVISGYLITTAKGQGVDVFGLFEVPALLELLYCIILNTRIEPLNACSVSKNKRVFLNRTSQY